MACKLYSRIWSSPVFAVLISVLISPQCATKSSTPVDGGWLAQNLPVINDSAFLVAQRWKKLSSPLSQNLEDRGVREDAHTPSPRRTSVRRLSIGELEAVEAAPPWHGASQREVYAAVEAAPPWHGASQREVDAAVEAAPPWHGASQREVYAAVEAAPPWHGASQREVYAAVEAAPPWHGASQREVYAAVEAAPPWHGASQREVLSAPIDDAECVVPCTEDVMHVMSTDECIAMGENNTRVQSSCGGYRLAPAQTCLSAHEQMGQAVDAAGNKVEIILEYNNWLSQNLITELASIYLREKFGLAVVFYDSTSASPPQGSAYRAGAGVIHVNMEYWSKGKETGR
ncbi:hypothetical protein CYMTET_32582, partial [Cymbomonas tetramitiformis]